MDFENRYAGNGALGGKFLGSLSVKNEKVDISKDSIWLQMYDEPPGEEFSLEDVIEMSLTRLRGLRLVESVGLLRTRGSVEYCKLLEKELSGDETLKTWLKQVRYSVLPIENKGFILYGATKILQLKIANLLETLHHASIKTALGSVSSSVEAGLRQWDIVSHFLLRLAYCRTEDLRRWFLQQEVDLFRFRFSRETQAVRERFLALNNLSWEQLPLDEREKLVMQLADAMASTTNYTKRITEFSPEAIREGKHVFYKVPWPEVADLVRSRSVLLKNGYAMVPADDVISLAAARFRSHLAEALATIARRLPALEAEERGRLLPILEQLYSVNTTTSQTSNASNGTEDTNRPLKTSGDVDKYSTSFSPCMRHMYSQMKQRHHLKHAARLQFGRFLKGAGLPLDHALHYWRTEFCRDPAMTIDRFDRNYAYSIRHYYGKEGRMTEYGPFSCVRIITETGPSGPGEAHGCPFRHWDAPSLRLALRNEWGLSSEAEIQRVMDAVGRGAYQLGCGQLLAYVSRNNARSSSGPQQPMSIDPVVIQSPNQYLSEALARSKISTD